MIILRWTNAMKLIATIVLLSSMTMELPAQTTETMPSMTYHALVQSLRRERQLQLDLEISPRQLAEISALLKSPKILTGGSKPDTEQLKYIEELAADPSRNHLLLEEIQRLVGPKEDARKKQLSIFCEKELKRILAPEQFNELRPVALRLQFPTGLSPFRATSQHHIHLPFGHDGALDLLVPSQESMQQLAPELLEIEKSRQTKLDDLCSSTAAGFVRELPQPTRERFVQLIGNEWTPEIPLDDSIPYQTLPSIHSWDDSTLTDHVLHVPGVKEKMNVTPAQFDQIRLIHEEYSASLQQGKPRNMSFREYDNALNRSVAKQVRRLLDDQQLLTFARHDGFWRFAVDCRRPFARKNFVTFLELSDEELKKIKGIAKKQYARYQANVLKIEQEAFQSVVSKLPDDSKRRVQRFFGTKWPLTAPEK